MSKNITSSPISVVGHSSGLSKEENLIVQLMTTTGVDWVKSCAEYAAERGVTQYWSSSNAIPLTPSTAFGLPLHFYICSNLIRSDIPPEYFVAHYNAHSSPQENFAEAEPLLISVLGEGKRQDTSNCLQRKWIFGSFVIELFAWPHEMQPKWLLESRVSSGSNSQADGFALITVTSKFAFIHPDEGLLWLAESLEERRVVPPDIAKFSKNKLGSGGPAPDILRARKNPSAFNKCVSIDDIVAWKKEDFFGVSFMEFTLKFKW